MQHLLRILEEDVRACIRLIEVVKAIESGFFSPEEPHRYAALMDMLHHDDRFMVCADFESYLLAQHKAATLWRRPEEWWRMSILNTAGMGWFSSARAIREYAEIIWGVPV